MQIIARCLKSRTSAVIAFVLVNIAWVLGIAQFVGPQIGGIFASFRPHSPLLELDKLACPFALTRDGYGKVVATVANPYDEPHGYTVTFYTATYQPDGYRDQPDDDRYPPFDYQEELACEQKTSIPPKQTAEASCTVNRPDVETDSIMVIVYAYSDHDLSKGMAVYESYESSYKGLCHIQSNRPTISTTQAFALLASVVELLGIGWVFALWKYMGTISRTIVIVVGSLAWGLALLLLAFIGAYLPLLALLTIVISIALTLWIINRRLEKITTGIIQ